MAAHNDKPFDWAEFIVRFGCGAVIGAIFGIGLWAKSPQVESTSGIPGFVYVGGAALICGLVAGFIGDRFWHSIPKWFQ